MNAITTPHWIETVARVGLSAKGVVYSLTGILAFMAAFNLGKGSDDAGRDAVFGFINKQPFGKVLLGVVVLGLICFCIWRLVQAFKDTENKGSKTKGLLVRARYLLSGITYSAIAYSTLRFLLTQQQSGGKDTRTQVAGELLSKPLGQWMVGIGGLIFIGIGIYQVYYALSGKYTKLVQGIAAGQRNLLLRTGQAGFISRGIVWLIIGWLFMKAGLQSDAGQAGGTNAAFEWLETSNYGSYLLGAVAIGLLCYGIFMFVRAKYQPIHTT